MLACLAILAVAGCHQADRAVFTPPTGAELPSFDEFEPTLPIDVGVEGAGDARGIVVVPIYEKIEPTPEERKILGDKPEPQLDALVLYRPPRGPEHGVSSEAFGVLIGVSGVGGALAGQEPAFALYGVSGFAGRHYGISPLARSEASVGRSRAVGAEAGLPWSVEVGEGLPRAPAQHATRRHQ
jgi:hypothetical protein